MGFKFYYYVPIVIILVLLSCCPASAKLFPAQIEPDEDWSREKTEAWEYNNLVYTLRELVYSSTKYPKEIRTIAENIVVVDAEDIQRMQAHTLSEVLGRITGVFVNKTSSDFGTLSDIEIQGSKNTQVLILVDGIKWNFLGGGNVEPNSIPIGIIKKIEIIKGPASSVWGSSLGGVINIITKSGESELMPEGMVSASIGEKQTTDMRAEISGKKEKLSYYLQGQRQSSDGLRYSRNFQNNSVYGKVEASLSDSTKTGAAFGVSSPEQIWAQNDQYDEEYPVENDISWGKLYLESAPSEKVDLSLAFHHFRQKLTTGIDTRGTWVDIYPPEKTVASENIFDETTTGIKSRLVYKQVNHTAVFGADYDREKLDHSSLLRLLPGPTFVETPVTGRWISHIDKFALYANDSVTLGKFSLTPGIRYDYNDVTGPFISPSFGTTFKAGADSVLRASVARGFSAPGLSYLSGGSTFLVPNPDLDPEEIWSYQAGFETAAVHYLFLKTTLFFHDVHSSIEKEVINGPYFHFINGERVKRSGFELDVKTSRYKDFSIASGFVFVNIDPEEVNSYHKYTFNVDLLYDDLESLSALLSGQYMGIDEEIDPEYTSDFIWDFNVSKKIKFLFCLKRSLEIYAAAHNIFNGRQYSGEIYKNPDRWVESGVRFNF